VCSSSAIALGGGRFADKSALRWPVECKYDCVEGLIDGMSVDWYSQACGSRRRCDLTLGLGRLIREGFFFTFGILFLSTLVYAQNDGARLFKSKCSACHGTDGSGDTDVGKAMGVPDLHSADVQKLQDTELTEIIRDGKGTQMPAFKDKLTDDQIKQLVSYIRELNKK